MSVFVIGDTHLSLGCSKPMDIFKGWENYVDRLESNWKAEVGEQDLVVLAGDISWGMSLEEALEDFRFLNRLPGEKWILKGNHDYWWNTKTKMEKFFTEHGLNTLHLLHNNFVKVGRYALCGTRGWILEKGTLQEQDVKVLSREAGRLEASLGPAVKEGLKPIVFLHYPPVFGEEISLPILEVLQKYQVERCYYGHIHGPSIYYAPKGRYLGISFQLISGDSLHFHPFPVELK